MLKLVTLLLISPAAAAQVEPETQWEDPYQGAIYTAVPKAAVPLLKTACDGDQYNKCTFSISVDYDADGKKDRIYMANFRKEGLIIVDFANKQKIPVVAASFESPWDGRNYISPDRDDKNAFLFIQPESSIAEFRMINGRPKVRWLSD